MAIQKTEALVLKVQPFRTTSLVVTAFSRTFGKIKGVVKGVRTEISPRPSIFEPFTLLEIVFYEKTRSELHLVSEATLLEAFEDLRRDLEILATAYYFVDLVDSLTESHDPHEAVFDLLHLAFQYLPLLPLSFLTRLFEVRMLHEVGLLPHLEGCLGCGEKHLGKVRFSVRQGGIFCPRCHSRSPEARLISLQALEAMRLLMHQDLAAAFHQPLNEEAKKEVGEVVEKFLLERLARPSSARQFLNQVRFLKAHRPGKRPWTSIHEAEENQERNQHVNR